jgi:hypothetical protein
MPRQGCPPAVRQEVKSVVQTTCHPANPEGVDTTCCKFNRQCNTVEPSADLRNNRDIFLLEFVSAGNAKH